MQEEEAPNEPEMNPPMRPAAPFCLAMTSGKSGMAIGGTSVNNGARAFVLTSVTLRKITPKRLFEGCSFSILLDKFFII